MTELNLLVAFFVNLSMSLRYRGYELDVKFLNSVSTYLTRTSDSNYFEQLITAFCGLDDAIVTGLSEGRFVFTHSSLARMRKSDLPRFLYGLLSTIFTDDGMLRDVYDANSVELCLQGLRLVRRAKSKALAAKAEMTAVENFISYQSCDRPGVLSTLLELSELWVELEGDEFHSNVKLGKPGNGVCNDMRFPYVPDLCFPDIEPTNDQQFSPNVSYLLTKARDDQFLKAGFTRGPLGWIVPNVDYVGLYYPVDHSVANLAVVPKKYNEGRAITTTTVFATILGATIRESLFDRLRVLGAIDMVNVHDQTKSHDVLENHFFSIACLDLKGGSSCFTTKNLDIILSKTEYVGDCWKASRPKKFKWKDKVYDLNTLTMGDSSSVALLSCTLFLALVLSYKRYHRINGSLATVIRLMNKDGRFRVVGDDIICPDYLLSTVKTVLDEMAVTINQRKSSNASSKHKESCGAWFIVDYVEKRQIRRIYPFRAAVPDNIEFCSVTQSIEQFVDKTHKSQYAYSAYKAHITVLLPLDERIKYDGLKSFTPSIVGTRFGRQWSTTYRSCKQDQQISIDDSLAYVCGIRDSLVTPRYARITQPLRLRHRKKCVDLTRSSSLTEHLRTIVFFNTLSATVQSLHFTCSFFKWSYKSHPVPRYKFIAWNNPAITSPGSRIVASRSY